MNKLLKTALCLALAVCMMASMVVVGVSEESEAPTYTYHMYKSALATNWNPHTWETNLDDAMLGYILSPLATMTIDDSENGVCQWIYVMASYAKDVTAEHQDDLVKYGVTLPVGKTAEETEAGFVFEIGLRENAKWEDGTPINADSYIYSMKQLLDPAMKNDRANLYYAGESAVAGADKYYYAGDNAYFDNGNEGIAVADMVKGEDGSYTTAAGEKVYIATRDALTWCAGNSLGYYVDTYGEAFFGMDGWAQLSEVVDENGRVALTDETLAMLAGVTTTNAAWGETEADCFNYMVIERSYPECDYDSTVGCYKVDDYTIRYVTQNYLDFNCFLTSLTSNWLVYEPYYEAGKDTTGKLVTTDYGTTVANTMSCGPYRLASLQKEKQAVLVKNENWVGFQKQDDGTVLGMSSFLDYLVDGEDVETYQTTSVVWDVMDPAAAKQAFLKGELSSWSPDTESLLAYSTSDQLYKVDKNFTEFFFFCCGLDKLKEMDNSKGNTNSVVLSNLKFRKAMSLAIDRNEYVTATEGWKPAYGMLNSLYYYDAYNNPNSQYRNTDAAMQAICNVYDVKYGEGTPYATLKDAYRSITGYNLTEAKQLMKEACEELVAAGLYTAGDPVHVRIGWTMGALTAADNKKLELLNKFVNAAVEGSGFGTITFEQIGNIPNRYNDVANGEYAIGYGAWGGDAFDPFRSFQLYCDPDKNSIYEAGSWDPKSETATFKVNGEDVTMTWQLWSRSMIGSGPYTEESFETKLEILAQMEENYMKFYYRIPLAVMTDCEMLSYQVNYYTEDYNTMYGFGGLELLNYNYTDAEWAEFVAEEGGLLSYE